MCLEMPFGYEALAAALEVAVIRSVTSVCPHVCLEISSFVELPHTM